jgi:hypothetical protein
MLLVESLQNFEQAYCKTSEIIEWRIQIFLHCFVIILEVETYRIV